MKKNIFITALITLAALLLVILPLSGSIADAGFFSGDSDFDFGGNGGSSFDWDNDYDYGYGYSHDTYGGSFFPVFFDGFGGVVVIFIVIVIIIIVINFKSSGSAGRQTYVSNVPPVNSADLDKLKEKDANFSEDRLKERVGNLYVEMQNMWQAKDFEPMRAHMTDSLYNQFARQLDELKRKKQTNYVERISVLGVNITGYRNDNVYDTLIVRLTTRIIDYTLDDNTGALVSGDKTKEKILTYEWSLIRPVHVKTEEIKSGSTTVNCPNCGAALDVNNSAKCPYCDSVISLNKHDWVISSIKGISQRS